MPNPAGVEKEQALRTAGFSDTEVEQWRAETAGQLQDAGFSGKEIGEYFGQKNPDMKPTKEYFDANLKKYQDAQAEKEKTALPQKEAGLPPKEVKHADKFLEYLEAGWDTSVVGLLKNGRPDVVTDETAPMYGRILSQIGTLAGDAPAMVLGAWGGGAAGAAAGSAIAPGPGTVLGAELGSAGGAFALPTAIRTTLMQHYEKGDVHDFGDFYERASAVLWESTKSFGLGAATAGAGSIAGKVAAPVLSAPLTATARAATEVATMTTVGKALEGQVPSASDFVEAGILVGAMHGAGKVAGKLRNTYAETGANPSEVAIKAQTDPVLKQELAADNIAIPGAVRPSGEAKPVEPPKPPPFKGSQEKLSDAAEKILSKVGEKGEKPAKSFSFDEVYRNYVDRLDPLKAGGEEAYQLGRMVNDYPAKVKHVVEFGTLDFKTLEKNGKSLKETLDPFEGNYGDFNAYLISKRALEIEASGRKSGFDVAAAKEVVDTGKSKYDKAAQEITEFSNRNLQYLIDSGRVSKELGAAFREAGKSYIPFTRVLDQTDSVANGGKANPLKRLKGSDAKIQDPIVSILENTETVFRLAEKNRAVEKLVTNVEKDEGQELIKKVPTQMRPVEIAPNEVKKLLEQQGIEATPEAITAFTPQYRELRSNEFEVYRGGKREVFETEPALAEAVKALDGDSAAVGTLMKLAKAVTTVKKIGISFTPDFILRNLFRDQLTAAAFSKDGSLPFFDIPSAMGNLMRKDEVYQSWLKSGGAGGAFLDLNKKYIETDVYKLNKETGFMDAVFNLAKKPVDFLHIAGSLTEQATRLAEFKRVTKGATSGPKVFEGGYASREITVDFQRMGAKVSALNAITAFQNVAIQGLDRTARAIKEDPKGVMLRSMAYITAPSVLLWYANHDDERYKEIPRWQKDLFWIIPTDSWEKVKDDNEAQGLPDYLVRKAKDGQIEINRGHTYRIPKPQELGILFGSLPERILEQFFTDNPKAFSDFTSTVGQLLTPSLVPDVASPAIEQHFNKSLFTGQSIVPHHLEGILPEYQYGPYTSESAKALSSLIASLPPLKESAPSPLILDNYIQSWTGNLGKYAIQIADEALVKAGLTPDPIRPAKDLAELPVIKAFMVRYPSRSAQSIQDFYDKCEENTRIIHTIRHLGQSGDFENLEKEMILDQNQEKLLKCDGIREGLTKQNSLIRLIQKDPGKSTDEKRQLIDSIYYQMTDVSKMGLEMMRGFEKEMKEQKEQKK